MIRRKPTFINNYRSLSGHLIANMSKSANIIPTGAAASAVVSLNDLMHTSWIRNHLYLMGSDLVRLRLYQKLSNVLQTGGGPLIKSMVYEMTSFIRREMGHGRSIDPQLKDLAFFGSNVGIVEPEVYEKYNIPEFRWLYITIGYMMITPQEELTDEVIEKVINFYMDSRNIRAAYYLASDDQVEKFDRLIHDYYEQVSVDYDLLYSTPKEHTYITLHETKDYHIKLPPLPRLKNKENLVKSLIHKELYSSWLHPDHFFAKGMNQLNISYDQATLKSKIKYELSFLDGLGDLYLAQESSNLLYKFEGTVSLTDNNIFGTRTYNQLKTILQTNTLLSQLAVAYNLHRGLKDELVNKLFREEYVTNINRWNDPELENDVRRYEQEFVADYFEQYVGALYSEQPEVASNFILEIYENTLRLISDVHKLSKFEKKRLSQTYNYRAWCVDVIGRNIWR